MAALLSGFEGGTCRADGGQTLGAAHALGAGKERLLLEANMCAEQRPELSEHLALRLKSDQIPKARVLPLSSLHKRSLSCQRERRKQQLLLDAEVGLKLDRERGLDVLPRLGELRVVTAVCRSALASPGEHQREVMIAA